MTLGTPPHSARPRALGPASVSGVRDDETELAATPASAATWTPSSGYTWSESGATEPWHKSVRHGDPPDQWETITLRAELRGVASWGRNGPVLVVPYNAEVTVDLLNSSGQVHNRFTLPAGECARVCSSEKMMLSAREDVLLRVSSAPLRDCPPDERHVSSRLSRRLFPRLTSWDKLRATMEHAAGRVRATRTMEPSILDTVRNVGELLADAVRSPGGFLSRDLPMRKLFNGSTIVMYQLTLYDDDAAVFRMHYFPADASETYVHNHRRNAASMCLVGSYTHQIWGVRQSAESVYYKTVRLSGGELGIKQEERGSLHMLAEYSHSPGRVWFLSADGFHSVKPHAAPGAVVSLYVGDKSAQERPACILSESDSAMRGVDGTREECQGEEKDRLLRRVEALFH